MTPEELMHKCTREACSCAHVFHAQVCMMRACVHDVGMSACCVMRPATSYWLLDTSLLMGCFPDTWCAAIPDSRCHEVTHGPANAKNVICDIQPCAMCQKHEAECQVKWEMRHETFKTNVALTHPCVMAKPMNYNATIAASLHHGQANERRSNKATTRDVG